MIEAGLRSPAASTARRGGRAVPVRRALGWLALGVGAFVLLRLGALHTVSPNSDNATIALEGAAMRSGDVGLHGWLLSLDSFWTLDAVAYALGAAIAGLRPLLMTDIPALIAAGVVLAAGALAGRGLPRRGRVVAFALVALALLGAPPAFLQFFLAGPYHVVTLLVCLGVFALLDEPTPLRSVLAGLLLVLGLLGDLQTLLLAVAPILAVGALELFRHRRRAAAGLWAVALGSLVVAELAHLGLRAAGGFQLAKANTAASGHQLFRNLAHLPVDLVALFGVTTSPFGPSVVDLPLRIGHLIGLVLAVGAVLLALAEVWGRRAERRGTTAPRARLEELLVAGIAFDLACFVALPIITSPAYGRYLTAGIVESLVLAGAYAGRLTAGDTLARRALAPAGRVGLGLLGVAGVGVYGTTAAVIATSSAPPAPAAPLARALERAGLSEGVGDYWSASLTTVESGGAVAVRPVIAVAGGRLVRYEKQSAASWYTGARFAFFVYNTALPWNGDTPEAARRTFGHVERTLVVGTYRVLVFSRPFTVSAVGSEGP